MSKMVEPQVRLLIRIPASLKAKLVELAAQEHRSLNREIEFLLDRAIRFGVQNERQESPLSKPHRSAKE